MANYDYPGEPVPYTYGQYGTAFASELVVHTLQWLILEGQRHTDTQKCAYSNFILSLQHENSSSSSNSTLVSFTSKAAHLSVEMMANDSLLEGLRIVAAEVASKYSNLLFPATLRFSTQDATGRIRCLITGCFFDSTLIINEKPHQSLKRNRDAIEDLNSATLEIEIPASTLDDSILINNVLGYLRLLRLVATISYAVRCELHGCRWRRTFDVISSRSRVLFFRRVDRGGDGRQVAISLHCYSRVPSLTSSERSIRVIAHPEAISITATGYHNLRLLFDVALGASPRRSSFSEATAVYKRLCSQLYVFGPGTVPITPVSVPVADLVDWSNYGVQEANKHLHITHDVVASSVHVFVPSGVSRCAEEEDYGAEYDDLQLFIFIDTNDIVEDTDNSYDLLSWLRSEDNLKQIFKNNQERFKPALSSLFDQVFYNFKNLNSTPKKKRVSDDRFIPAIARSLTRILHNSTNGAFRTACLQLTQTTYLEEFQVITESKLRSITSQLNGDATVEADSFSSGADSSLDPKESYFTMTPPLRHSDSPAQWNETTTSKTSIPNHEDVTDWIDFDNWGDSVDSADRQILATRETQMVPLPIPSPNSTNRVRQESSTLSQDTALSDQTEWNDDRGSTTTASCTECEDESWMWEDELERQENNTDQVTQPPAQFTWTDQAQSLYSENFDCYTNKHSSGPVELQSKHLHTEEVGRQSDAFWEL